MADVNDQPWGKHTVRLAQGVLSDCNSPFLNTTEKLEVCPDCINVVV